MKTKGTMDPETAKILAATFVAAAEELDDVLVSFLQRFYALKHRDGPTKVIEFERLSLFVGATAAAQSWAFAEVKRILHEGGVEPFLGPGESAPYIDKVLRDELEAVKAEAEEVIPGLRAKRQPPRF